ncbi:MAG TPA: EAL domain-containing protein [Burkholderiales bacterium]|nr:EAL domain-containing protein [Burkholderiales bacterium]
MFGEHERWLVLLAVTVAGIAACIPLRLAIRGWRTGDRSLRHWIPAAALSVFTALFGLQLTGMLALDVPLRATYDVPVTLLSLVMAIAVCGFAMHIQARELTRTNDMMRDSERRYRQLVELSPDAICIESDGRITFANTASVRLFGAADAEDLVGKPLVELLPGAAHVRALTDQHSALEQKLRRLDGSTVDIELVAAPLKSEGNVSAQLVMRDITERKKAEERLNHLANYDPLTGLPNRALFRDRIGHALARAKRQELLMAVMLIDLDHFKEINDTLGHSKGDQVLQALTGVLRSCIRDTDTLARLAGDEFSIIVEHVRHVDDAVVVADKIISALSKPLVIDGQEIFVTVSIGIAMFPFSADSIEQLVQAADIALYRVKDQGRNGYEFYSPEMNADAAERLQIENLLRRAIERDEFSVQYQPKIAVHGGRVTGVEALLRWRSAELGFVPPDRFIPLAEKTGLIVPIGEWILRKACAQARAWQVQGLPPIVVSVNLSARQFRQPKLADMVASVLRETGLQAQYLELEITESLMMTEKDHAIVTVDELHALGVQISVDDFGTGYSNLAYLKRFPVQKLKVDKSFVQDATSDAEDSKIVAAVVALAKSMDLAVVAEGVETAEQLQLLAHLGCDEYQGYFFSEPLSAPDLEPLLLPRRAGAAA